MKQKRTVYLDYSASTPTDPRVVDAMLPYFTETFGNPSSSHSFGRKAETAVEVSRETVAGILNCSPSEIIFTSGGSESDNLAIRGAAWSARTHGRDHLVTTPIEHSAVSKTIRQLRDVMSFRSSVAPVDQYGMVISFSLADALTDQTALVSIVYANNEIGTIQPIAHLAGSAHERGAVFHTDAVQAAGQISLDTKALGVDLLSLSAHKFYGPKGIGVLYARSGIELVPAQSGGSHESGRRAGTHNTPAIVGLAKALQLAYDEQDERRQIVLARRAQLIDGILTRVPHAVLTGHPEDRLPSHASFLFSGIDGNKLVMHLDMRGVAASSASACKVGNPEPSGVLLALGYNAVDALGSLRLTLSHHTTEEEIQYAVDMVVESVETLRRLEQKTVF